MRCVKARDSVAREISDHITDQTQAYEQSGMEHDKAVEKAVRGMGDPVEIGVSMDRIHRPQVDWRMLLLTLVLSIAGFLCMTPFNGIESLISRQSFFMFAGFAVIAAVYLIDYSIIGRIGAAAYLVITVLFFILQRSLPTINGRQPSLFILVYLYVPVFAGILYQLRMRGYAAVIMGAAIIGVTFIAVAFFSSSFIVAINIFLIMVVMLSAAIVKGMFGGNKKRMAAITAAVAILPMLLSVWCLNIEKVSFRWRRVDAFIHRYKYKDGEGYIYGVIGDILQNIKLMGEGNSEYIVENGVASSVGNELMPLLVMYKYGIIAGILMLILLAALILRSMKIVRCQKNQLGFLVSMACSLVIFINCFEGILVSMGLFPITTTAIPFLSRGGSTIFVYSVLIGLLLGVHRYEKVYTKETFASRPRWQLSLKIEKR